MKKMSFEDIDAVIKYLESCFDENNNDDSSVDERIEAGLNKLLKNIKEIIIKYI